MSIHASYYGHVNGLFEGDKKPVVATKKKIHFLDLVRPDFYLGFNVDQVVGILIWLKKEILRVTPYSGRCDYFYRHCKDTHLIGNNYWDKISEIMLHIFLGIASELGRHRFDKIYNLKTTRTLPIQYYKTHAPVEWGKSQLDLFQEITNPDKKLRFNTWYPNSSHKKARSIFYKCLVVTHEGFFYNMNYSYPDDSSSWYVHIYPSQKQLLVDFMLDVKWWIDNGLKKQHLENLNPEMGTLSSVFKIVRSEDKC